MRPVVGVVLAVAGVVCAGVSVVLDGGVPREEPAWGASGVAGVVLAALLVVLDVRVYALLSAMVAAYAVYLFVVDVWSGVAGPSSAVLVVGAVAVLVGGWARLMSSRVGEPWPLRTRVVAVVGALVVLSAGGGAVVGQPLLVVDAESVGVVLPEPVVDRPRGEQWQWTADAPIVEVVVAGAGLVVGTDDGELVAVGPGGARRWHYGRPRAHLEALSAAPDGTLVVAAYRGRGSHDRAALLEVLLDAVTGEVLREWTSPREDVLTTTTLVGWESVDHPDGWIDPRGNEVDPRDYRVHGEDLRAGGRLWSWSAPSGCVAPNEPVAGVGVVLVDLVCPASVGVVALGDRDGQERWRYEIPTEPGGAEARLVALTGGAAVTFTAIGHGTTVLRTRDGEPVSESARLFTPSDSGPIALSWEETVERRWRVVGVDPEDGVTHPVIDVPCTGRLPAATTRTTLMWICTTTTGAELMWQEWGATTANRLPLAGWPPLWDDSADYYRVDVLPAPGFLALVRYGEEVVTGYPG